MLWIIFALLEPILHGFANILDNNFINNLFKRTTTLIFYASLTNIFFLPIIFLLDFPSMITIKQIPFFIILGFTSVGYLYPYYKSLKEDETSIVVSLFSLGKIFVPILAFFFVGEMLTLKQYLGFFIIIISGALLAINGKNKFRINSSFYWMILCSFILAVEVVVYKYIFNFMSWGTGFTWASIFSFIFIIPLIFIPKVREDIKLQIKQFKSSFFLFILEEFLTFGGSAGLTFAISIASVTLVEVFSSFQPIFVLIYAVLLSKFFPNIFKENISRESIVKKTILFIIMIAGILIIFI